MPVATSSRLYQDHIPSFMSVYNVDSQMTDTAQSASEGSISDAQIDGIRGTYAASNERAHALNQKINTQHQHNDSTSTQASDSTDSSPTTTISTVDSSSLTDPSPSSSPESPISIIPLSSFSSQSFGLHTLDDLTMSDFPPGPPPRPMNYERPMTSPSPRKPRNAKGLALKLDSPPSQASAPSSPSFVKPAIPKARKKPSILSLQTSATSTINARLANNALPQSPGPIRTTTIRHHHSSPQLMFSPDPRGFSSPEGGMQLPPFERCRTSGLSTAFRKPSALKESSSMGSESTIQEEESPIRTQMATRSIADISGDIFDAPASQEDAKSPGYPEGPVAIYEPNVYLYLEPTVEEASKFDVILNVAQEVKNPFEAAKEKEREKLRLMSSGNTPLLDRMDLDDRDNIPIPDTAVSTASFATAFEVQPPGAVNESPTTPKPSNVKEPEYIHIPWEHNTDIAKDLMGLCDIIDTRAKEGKKVLVHCQQGASRSASLIIAYGLYMNPDLSVNDAYHAAQAKSRWISPNMKLMYALQDFQKEVEIKKQITSSFKSRSGRSPTKHRATLSADAIEYSPKEPQTAPLPSDRDSSNQRSSRPGTPRLRGNSTPGYRDVSPGPHSAPSGYSWDATFNLGSKQSPINESPSRFGGQPGLWNDLRQPRFVFPPPDSGFVSQSNSGFGSHRNSHSFGKATDGAQESKIILSLPEVGSVQRQFTNKFIDDVPPTPSLWSPRIQEFTGNPLHQTLSFSSFEHDDVPPTPGIMSPRATQFSINPFHDSPSFSSLRPMSNFRFTSFGTPSPNLKPQDDPRSPPTKGEAPIIRSIDDVL